MKLNCISFIIYRVFWHLDARRPRLMLQFRLWLRLLTAGRDLSSPTPASMLWLLSNLTPWIHPSPKSIPSAAPAPTSSRPIKLSRPTQTVLCLSSDPRSLGGWRLDRHLKSLIHLKGSDRLLFKTENWTALEPKLNRTEYSSKSFSIIPKLIYSCTTVDLGISENKSTLFFKFDRFFVTSKT